MTTARCVATRFTSSLVSIIVAFVGSFRRRSSGATFSLPSASGLVVPPLFSSLPHLFREIQYPTCILLYVMCIAVVIMSGSWIWICCRHSTMPSAQNFVLFQGIPSTTNPLCKPTYPYRYNLLCYYVDYLTLLPNWSCVDDAILWQDSNEPLLRRAQRFVCMLFGNIL